MLGFSFLSLSAQSEQPFRSVSVNEFEIAVTDTSYVVLDVRMPVEYAEGHIPGTDYNIDVLEDNFKEEALKKLPKDKPVALYCRSGNRSKTAARILTENGYPYFRPFLSRRHQPSPRRKRAGTGSGQRRGQCPQMETRCSICSRQGDNLYDYHVQN